MQCPREDFSAFLSHVWGNFEKIVHDEFDTHTVCVNLSIIQNHRLLSVLVILRQLLLFVDSIGLLSYPFYHSLERLSLLLDDRAWSRKQRKAAQALYRTVEQHILKLTKTPPAGASCRVQSKCKPL